MWMLEDKIMRLAAMCTNAGGDLLTCGNFVCNCSFYDNSNTKTMYLGEWSSGRLLVNIFGGLNVVRQ